MLPLSCSNLEFLHLGMSFPFYFDFIKQCIALLIVQFILSSIPSIIINLRSDNCKEFDESASFICRLSFLNVLSSKDLSKKHQTRLNYENLMNMIFLLVSMIMICAFQLQQKVKKQRLEKYKCSISDFSIYITRLPDTFHMNELIYFIRARVMRKFPKEDIPDHLTLVKSYKLCDLKEYADLYAKKVSCIKKKLKLQRQAQKLLCGGGDENNDPRH